MRDDHADHVSSTESEPTMHPGNPSRPHRPCTGLLGYAVVGLAASALHCECDTTSPESYGTSGAESSTMGTPETPTETSAPSTGEGTGGSAEAGGGSESSGASSGASADGETEMVVCGDGECEGAEDQQTCCADCGCPQGSGCEAGICVADSSCGNGVFDPGEVCDGSNLDGASCASVGFDGGELSCTVDCMLNTSACCDDECAGIGDVCEDDMTMQSCSDFDGDACLELGNAMSCPEGQVCSTGSCACDSGDEGHYEVLSAAYPNFGSPGCSGDGSLKLKAGAEMISPSILRIHVRKEDGSPFTTASTLSLYVGGPIHCIDPFNIKKTTKAVVIDDVDQHIDLTVDPYNGAWPVGETKEFWVGKDEGGFDAFRATGIVSVKHICDD